MADATYQPKVFRSQGSTELVVASGGKVRVESGGTVNVESGGAFQLAGTALTVTAAEANLLDNQVASVTFTLGSSTAWKKNVDIQLKDAAGTAMVGNQFVRLAIIADAAGAAFITPTAGATLTTSTGGTTCDVIQMSTSAPQISFGLTSTGGALSMVWSDTGKVASYLAVILPNGSMAISTGAITTTS